MSRRPMHGAGLLAAILGAPSASAADIERLIAREGAEAQKEREAAQRAMNVGGINPNVPEMRVQGAQEPRGWRVKQSRQHPIRKAGKHRPGDRFK